MFSYPDKPRRGDAIAVLSPSAPLPARLPLPYELGLRRLREEFGLRPVEYPTTRARQASPAERAADIHAAFAGDLRDVLMCLLVRPLSPSVSWRADSRLGRGAAARPVALISF